MRSSGGGFFGVVADPQSYMNILYLLLSLPLGVIYFTFLVTGISLGFGLLVTLIGIPILAGVLIASYGMSACERALTRAMLRIDIPPATTRSTAASLLERFVALLSDPVTWKGVVYLLTKLVVGIVSFSITVTLLATSVALILAPLYYAVPGTRALVSHWQVDMLPWALLLMVVGVFLGVGSLHACNALAWVSGRFARVMLGGPRPAAKGAATSEAA